MAEERTISSNTEIDYAKRASGLIKRYEDQTGINVLNNQDAFLDWVDSLSPTLSPATRRLYRASIHFYFKASLQRDVVEENSEFLRGSTSKKQVQREYGKRTSALKVKKMDASVWQRLEPILSKSRSPYAQLALNVLIASKIFGLRPFEWSQAQLFYDEINGYGLRVINAKATQGRSHGETRTLWFLEHEYESIAPELEKSILSANWLISFFKALKNSSRSEIDARNQIDSQLMKARQYLNQLFRTHKKLSKVPKNKRITLYSARHQFAADAKKSGLAPEEVAALMGHASINTNQKYYGRRINGRSGLHVKAHLEDIESVLQKNSADIMPTQS